MKKDIIGELTSFYSSLEYQKSQMQQYQQKLPLEQVQDLENCIKILRNTLSYAENYSAMYGNNAKFEFTNYDYFNASKNTEKSLNFKKFAAAINNLDSVYEYYLSRYNEEPLPKSLSKNDIIMRLKNYRDFMKDKIDIALYDDLINVFSRNPINNVKDEISKFKGDGTMDPNKIKNAFLKAQGIATQQQKEVAENYMKNPNYINLKKINSKLNNEIAEIKNKYKLLQEKIIIDKSSFEKENKELKDKLIKANKIIENQTKEIQDLNNQINSFKNLNNNNQINFLKNEIIIKDNQINELKKQIQNINLNKNETNFNPKDIKCVTFISTDQSIFYGIPCNGNSTFAEVEEKLYKEYPEYRETNNLFYANGKEILRFKTINDNLIGTGKPVMLVKPS